MLIQKFHAALRHDQSLALAGSNAPLFSRQGHWDGGSPLHCVAMALALLGKLADPVALPHHTVGAERVVWDHAWPHYLHGLTFSELASFVAELGLGVRPATCTASGVDLLRFVERELQAGWPVILGWSHGQPAHWHAALVVGIEGYQSRRAFTPHALLLLDPAGETPRLAGFNARIDVPARGRVRFHSPDATHAIRLRGALSIRSVKPAVLNATGCA
ncbi:hypothetical protein [Burkholderia pseudomallei]|uniref:hypothetical protein n=1 Tax=Burkholderia pseudomallei TaxID=28450 RepID=UPI0005312982|nr:hypothetical protein [Burkholderia pseudomallei]KGR98758.1 hypothetical protein X977_5110 [Burkholderia pseudomallei MSHR7504]